MQFKLNFEKFKESDTNKDLNIEKESAKKKSKDDKSNTIENGNPFGLTDAEMDQLNNKADTPWNHL